MVTQTEKGQTQESQAKGAIQKVQSVLPFRPKDTVNPKNPKAKPEPVPVKVVQVVRKGAGLPSSPATESGQSVENESPPKSKLVDSTTTSQEPTSETPSSETSKKKKTTVVETSPSEVVELPEVKDLELRFSPTAWAKLVWFRDHGHTEISGFGITELDDLLFVKDFAVIPQKVSSASIEFPDDAIADFFADQVDLGRQPKQFARIWIHTHPGNGAHPSGVDDETFERVFGECDWALMFILASGGMTHSVIRFNVGPRADIEVPTIIEYSEPFAGTNEEEWETLYDLCIEKIYVQVWKGNKKVSGGNGQQGFGYGHGQADSYEIGSYRNGAWRPRDELDKAIDAWPKRGTTQAEEDEADRAAVAAASRASIAGLPPEDPSQLDADEWVDALEEMTPEDRDAVLSEIMNREDLWRDYVPIPPEGGDDDGISDNETDTNNK